MSKKNFNTSLIVKSNSLIEASYKLTLQEQRIILFMASMIQPNDEDFKPIKIDINEFINLIKITGHSKYNEIKEITKQLRKRDLIIKSDKSELQIGWLSSAEYFQGEGYVELEFSPKLKPYLLQLKERFTKYYLQNIIQLSHSYSIRFYELLKQYEKIGWRIFELKELREILGISGNEYVLFANFKQKILEPAKKELQTKAEQGNLDLSFDYEEIKLSRKVDKIKFIILKPTKENKIERTDQPNNQDASEANQEDISQSQSQPPEPPAQNQDLLNLLLSLKVSKAKAMLIMKTYPAEQIKQNLDYAKNNSNKVKNITAFIVKAIEENYYATSQEKFLKDQEIERQQAIDKENRLRQENEEKRDKAKAIQNKKREQLLPKYESMTIEEKIQVTERYLQAISYYSKKHRKFFDKDGLFKKLPPFFENYIPD